MTETHRPLTVDDFKLFLETIKPIHPITVGHFYINKKYEIIRITSSTSFKKVELNPTTNELVVTEDNFSFFSVFNGHYTQDGEFYGCHQRAPGLDLMYSLGDTHLGGWREEDIQDLVNVYETQQLLAKHTVALDFHEYGSATTSTEDKPSQSFDLKSFAANNLGLAQQHTPLRHPNHIDLVVGQQPTEDSVTPASEMALSSQRGPIE